jgi:hypothetical protein
VSAAYAARIAFLRARCSARAPRRQTLWGQPTPRSWFEEGSAFAGTSVREALFKADVIVAAQGDQQSQAARDWFAR